MQFETRARAGAEAANGKQPRRRQVEYFWLCGECSRKLTLMLQEGIGVVTVPRKAQDSPLTTVAAAGMEEVPPCK